MSHDQQPATAGTGDGHEDEPADTARLPRRRLLQALGGAAGVASAALPQGPVQHGRAQDDADITLDNPTGDYVVASEVDINGTTSPGVDEVVIYASPEDTNAAYLRVTTITVDGDDTFEEEDFNLVEDSDNPNALNILGTYRIATLDADSSELDDNDDGFPDNLVDSEQVSAAAGSQTSLNVVDQFLTLDTATTTIDQVAAGDEITVEGVAPGQDAVSVFFYGPRGGFDVTSIPVDEDGEFSDDSVQVGFNLFSLANPAADGTTSSISLGEVVMTVFSGGRDGVAGDGDPPAVQADVDGDGVDETGFTALFYRLNAQSFTQEQVIDRVASETTEDTGSDDIAETVRFQLVDPQTRRVSSLEILNQNGADVSDGTVSNDNAELTVVAEYNFEESEPLELTVEDESGLDVTGRALADGESATDASSPANFDIDLSELETGEEYTVTVAGSDDLDSGAAQVSATFELSAQDERVEFSIEAPETIQPGETLTVTAELTNQNFPDPSSGQIQLTTVPDPLSVTGENPVFLGFAGNTLPAVGESLTQQFEVDVPEQAAVGQERTLEAEAVVQTSADRASATATQPVTIAEQQDPVERFDTNGQPGIQGDEVLDAISEFNEGGDVEPTDVLDVISAFNESG